MPAKEAAASSAGHCPTYEAQVRVNPTSWSWVTFAWGQAVLSESATQFLKTS
jgi:hypothetical protein